MKLPWQHKCNLVLHTVKTGKFRDTEISGVTVGTAVIVYAYKCSCGKFSVSVPYGNLEGKFPKYVDVDRTLDKYVDFLVTTPVDLEVEKVR